MRSFVIAAIVLITLLSLLPVLLAVRSLRREPFTVDEKMELLLTLTSSTRAKEIQHTPLTLFVNKLSDDNGVPMRLWDTVQLNAPAEPGITGRYYVVAQDQEGCNLAEAKTIQVVQSSSPDGQVIEGVPDTTLDVGDKVFFNGAFYVITVMDALHYSAEKEWDTNTPKFACRGDEGAVDKASCEYGCHTWLQQCSSTSHCPVGMSCEQSFCT